MTAIRLLGSSKIGLQELQMAVDVNSSISDELQCE